MEQHVQLISGAIDKAFKSGVYGVQEAQQILNALGALQNEHYSKQAKKDIPNMEVVADEVVEPKSKN
tara:strand:- start:9107 stop:9307 length:201 start_codon:yes stop_codon:yes gene_type:complete